MTFYLSIDLPTIQSIAAIPTTNPQETRRWTSQTVAPTSASRKPTCSPAANILCAYKMKPKAGHGYLEAAAHFTAESSTGTNVEVCTTDDFTKGVDALVYHIDPANGNMRIAYPLDLFDRGNHRRPDDAAS